MWSTQTAWLGLELNPLSLPILFFINFNFLLEKMAPKCILEKNVTRVEDAAVFPTDENEDLEKLDLSWGSVHQISSRQHY